MLVEWVEAWDVQRMGAYGLYIYLYNIIVWLV